MLIDVEAVLRVANALGISGAVIAYAKQRFSSDARQQRVSKRLSTLSSEEVLEAAGDDPLLLGALAEQRRTLAFEAMAGFQASGGERAVILGFVRDRNGRYHYGEVQAARRMLRWDGQVHNARTTRGDRAFNWVYRNASFGLAMLGMILVVAGILLGMAPSFVLTAMATVVLGAVSARQLYSEHRVQMLADDLQAYSERLAQESGEQPTQIGQSGQVHTPLLPMPSLSHVVLRPSNGSQAERVEPGPGARDA